MVRIQPPRAGGGPLSRVWGTIQSRRGARSQETTASCRSRSALGFPADTDSPHYVLVFSASARQSRLSLGAALPVPGGKRPAGVHHLRSSASDLGVGSQNSAHKQRSCRVWLELTGLWADVIFAVCSPAILLLRVARRPVPGRFQQSTRKGSGGCGQGPSRVLGLVDTPRCPGLWRFTLLVRSPDARVYCRALASCSGSSKLAVSGYRGSAVDQISV